MIDERTGQNLVHDSNSVDLIAQDVRQNMVARRREQRFNNLARRLWLDLLIDDAKNGQRRQLVRAQMGQVRREARGQQVVPGWETRGIKKPRQEQRTVRVSGQRDRVEDHGGGNPTLLVDGNVGALEAGSHAPSTEAALSNFPHAIHDGVKDKFIGRRSESQAASVNRS